MKNDNSVDTDDIVTGNLAQKPLILAVVLIFLSGLIVYIYYASEKRELYGRLVESQQAELTRIAKTIPARLQWPIQDLFYLISEVEDSGYLQFENENENENENERKSLIRLFSRLMQQRQNHYAQVRYLDINGLEQIRIDNISQQTLVTPQERLQNKKNRYYFSDVIKLQPGQIYFSPFDLNIENGQIEQPYNPMIRIAAVVADPLGNAAGVVIINYSGEMLRKRLADIVLENSAFWLLNPSGYWLISDRESQEWGFMWPDRQDLTLKLTNPDLWQKMNDSNAGETVSLWQDNELFSWVRYPLTQIRGTHAETHWWVMLTMKAKDVDELLSEIHVVVIFNGLILILGSLLLSWVYYRQLSHQNVIVKLKLAEATTNASKRFRAALNASPSAMLLVSENQAIQLANPQAAQLLGYAEDQLSGMSIEHLIPSRFRDNHQQFFSEYWKNPQIRKMSQHRIIQALTRNGDEVPVDILLTPTETDEGPMVLVSLEDISERLRMEADLHASWQALEDANRDLEKRVEMRTRELESVNAELEAFAYSVSHDLRTPLRSVDGFSNMVLRKYGDKLDEKGVDLLQRMRDSAQHMGRLIADLLALSRIGRQEIKRQQVNLSEIAETVIAGLQEQSPERQVETEIEADMVISADKGLMEAVLSNLIGNAWKYSSKNDQAKIRFYTQKRDGKVWYVIEDNGAGFNMDYADKLFAPFQRLHSAADFEGSGIGLSTVQRIISKHHGQIEAESELNKGAIFRFTIA